MRRACTALAVLLPLLLAPVLTAETPREAARRKSELQNIRDEIKRQESALKQRKRDEKAATDYLARLDREIDVSHAYLSELNQDVDRLAQQVELRGQRVRSMAAQKDTLASRVRKRLVSFYIHGRAQEIDLLLSIRSLQQAQVWLRYQKMIAEADRRNLQSLALRQQQLEKEESYLRQERLDKARALTERTAEEQALRSSREKRSAYLLSVRKDKKVLEQRLRDSRASEKQILALITRAEQARLSAVTRKPQQPAAVVAPPVIYSGRFAGMKGRLTWPVRGAVVSRFGRQRHPELNTITENLGIDIKAREGGTVVAVGDGQVQTITWQRGSGNIVIISHGDGFYTVYTHLEEIRVSQDDPVRQGQAIGTVGESGSFNGPVLHFQIWKNTHNLNPEEWLG